MSPVPCKEDVMENSNPGVLKTFLLIDDNHPDFYVGRFRRYDFEIKPALRSLKIGDILNTSPFPGRGIQRER